MVSKEESESPPRGSDSGDPLEEQDDEGWEDAEPEEENITVVCLFGKDQFSNVPSMLQHCKDKHDFDLASLKHKFGVWVFASPTSAVLS